jgi:hypothetical protein
MSDFSPFTKNSFKTRKGWVALKHLSMMETSSIDADK